MPDQVKPEDGGAQNIKIRLHGADSAYRHTSWPDVISDLMHDMGDRGFIWRGQQKASWGLQTSLERTFRAGNVPADERGSWEQQALSYFRAHSASYLEWCPDDGDLLDWLVTMQHYGAPTRLLDWSESPFVATYFAYRDISHDQCDPAVLWLYDARLSIMTLRESTKTELPDPRDVLTETGRRRGPWTDEINDSIRQYVESKSKIPFAIAPLRPDPRMSAQQTILTVDACLEGGVGYPLSGSGGLPLLFKTELPAEWRREVLRDLALMGISETSLFPGLEGIAQHSRRIILDRFRHIRNELEGH